MVLFMTFCLFGVAVKLLDDRRVEPLLNAAPESINDIAVLGASGTAGDGILKAALSDPDVHMIHVLTRRPTPRIEAGVASGKVVMTRHMDRTAAEQLILIGQNNVDCQDLDEVVRHDSVKRDLIIAALLRTDMVLDATILSKDEFENAKRGSATSGISITARLERP